MQLIRWFARAFCKRRAADEPDPKPKTKRPTELDEEPAGHRTRETQTHLADGASRTESLTQRGTRLQQIKRLFEKLMIVCRIALRVIAALVILAYLIHLITLLCAGDINFVALIRELVESGFVDFAWGASRD